MEKLDYLTKGIERMFRGTSYQPLYQPSYLRNGFNRLLEKYNILVSKINQRIKNERSKTR